MDEMTRRCLAEAGVDTEDALRRFLGNEALLLKFLARLGQDENFPRLCDAMARGDEKAAFEAAHTLKGVCGNLSLQELSRQVSDLVESLRAGRIDAAAAQLPAVEREYHRAKTALEALS